MLFRLHPVLSSSLFLSGFHQQNTVGVLPLSHACHMPRPFELPRFDHSNNTCGGVQIIKLLITQFSTISWYILFCTSKYFLKHPIREHYLSLALGVRKSLHAPVELLQHDWFRVKERFSVLYRLAPRPGYQFFLGGKRPEGGAGHLPPTCARLRKG